MPHQFSTAITSVLFLACSIAHAQESELSGGRSFDVPVDPRSVALGESFAGVSGDAASFMYNPTSIASLRGLTFSYGKRDADYINNFRDSKYESITGTYSTAFGTFGAYYFRYSTGDYYDVESSPSVVYNDHDYTAGVVFARTIVGNLSGGIALKTFQEVKTISGQELFETIRRPTLFDFGLLYTFRSKKNSNPQLSIGCSVQNIGTTLVERPSPTFVSSPEYIVDYVHRLPRYVRIGFSFRIQSTPRHEGDLVPLTIFVTGENQHLLTSYNNPYYNSVWGAGGEFSIYEILSLRVGQSSQSLDNPRYGIGIRLPMDRFGIAQPLTLHGDYAVIPLRTSILQVFSISLSYEDNLF